MKTFKVTTFVSWKKVCVDPQETVILRALQQIVDPQIRGVKIGRRFILTIVANDEASARQAAEKACDKLLANYNTEEYEIGEIWEEEQTA